MRIGTFSGDCIGNLRAGGDQQGKQSKEISPSPPSVDYAGTDLNADVAEPENFTCVTMQILIVFGDPIVEWSISLRL